MNSPADFMNKAKQQMLLKNISRALDILSLDETKSSMSDFLKGLCFFYAEDFEAALLNLTSSLKLGKKDKETRLLIFVCTVHLGKYENAFKAFEKLKKISPANSEKSSIQNLSEYFEPFDSIDRQMQKLEEKIKQRPENSSMEYFKMGRLFELKGKQEQAIYCFTRAEATEPKNFQSTIHKAVLLALADKEEDALYLLESALDKNQGNPFLASLYAFLCLSSKNTSVASAQFSLAKQGFAKFENSFSATNLKLPKVLVQFMDVYFSKREQEQALRQQMYKQERARAKSLTEDSGEIRLSVNGQRDSRSPSISNANIKGQIFTIGKEISLLEAIIKEKVLLQSLNVIFQPEVEFYSSSLKSLLNRILRIKEFYAAKNGYFDQKELSKICRYFAKLFGFIVPFLQQPIQGHLAFTQFFTGESEKKADKEMSLRARKKLLKGLASALQNISLSEQDLEFFLRKFCSLVVLKKCPSIIDCEKNEFIQKGVFKKIRDYIEIRTKQSFFVNLKSKRKHVFFQLLKEMLFGLENNENLSNEKRFQLVFFHAFVLAAIVAQNHVFEPKMDINVVTEFLVDKLIQNAFLDERE